MRKTLIVSAVTLVLLASLDGLITLTLGWVERSGRMSSLVQYFEYGRSVPGKLERWEQNPGVRGNLYDVAWPAEIIANSQKEFAIGRNTSEPVIRSYGMSFVNNILRATKGLEPSLIWDSHSGPAAPPNFTYAVFEQDRENRRPKDIVVLGILSSSVTAMAALSNRSWAFEQPAPFTYPIYWPDGENGLRPVTPLINSPTEQRALTRDSDALKAWRNQLATEDAFYAPQTFGLIWADQSPFARLVRRSFAKEHIAQTKVAILSGQYPYTEVLQRMISRFALQARTDSQIPVVMLIQTGDLRDPDLLSIAKPVLTQHDIPYFATAEHFDPQDPSGFVSDGHYLPRVDHLFAEVFLEQIGLLKRSQ
ncbi:MAG: hypothetical protein AAF528_02835 [Cyanobacteria bacterium P01_C01_bin.121]